MARRCKVIVVAALVLQSMFAMAETPPNGLRQADALLSIDQHRATVIDRIVRDWGDALAASGAGLKPDQLRTMLNGLRADQLLAASLAGTLDGLRNVLAIAVASPASVRDRLTQTKALGDAADDLVYTPISPCRLFDTRPSQGGLGVMQPNLRRSYGAVTPVTNQGGPGGCSAPSGAAVALIQIGTLTPSGNGYLQGGAQGVASFPNALILYQPGDQYGTAVAMPLNPANGEFDVQVQFAATDLYGDLLGYFKAPGGQYFMQGGNTFGTTAKLGTLDNQPLELYVNNVRAMRYEYNASGTNVIGGISTNAVSGSHFQVTIGGGGGNTANANQATISGGGGNVALGTASTVSGGVGNNASGFESVVTGGASNAASGTYSTVGGGNSNTASGDYSYAAGFHANANGSGCFVFSDASSANPTSCFSPQVFVVRAINGFYFFTGGSSDATYTGAQLVHGSSAWSTYSDRSGKENIEAIDPREVLSKLVAMPIATWNWKSQEAGTRHMGPMAQDFRTAFGLGEDDRHITTVDSEGVALAAIQGLHQLVQEKDARIEALEGAVAELKRLVEAFEVKQER